MKARIFPDPKTLAETAAIIFRETALKAVQERGYFAVALAGGSTPRIIYRYLTRLEGLPWDDIHVFFGDERCVPPTHPDSNYRMAEELLFNRVRLKERNIHRIKGELRPEEAAYEYSLELDALGEAPVFDLIYLGVGPDGHTASLFPGGPELDSIALVVSSFPVTGVMPQVARVSLGFAVINQARHVHVVATGEDKAGVLAQVTRPGSSLPAARVSNPNTTWFLDVAAGRLLDADDQEID